MKRKKNVLIYCLCVFLIVMLYFCYTSKPNISHRLQWWLDEINWDEEREGYTGEGVTIAVLDTGVDTEHPDLRENIKSDIRIKSLQEGRENDKLHGTAIAGIIGAYPSNEKGVLGVAPNATVLSIDITDEETIEYQNIVEGIKIAIEKDVDIISISLGLKKDYPEVHACIKEAYDKGIIIVASAGNYMTDDILYPAKYEEVIAVGALDKKGEIISPSGNILQNIVYLPGENIVTTSCGEKEYVGATGTSFSTAILSGIIAIMLEVNPNIDSEEIYSYYNCKLENNIDVRNWITEYQGE